MVAGLTELGRGLGPAGDGGALQDGACYGRDVRVGKTSSWQHRVGSWGPEPAMGEAGKS